MLGIRVGYIRSPRLLRRAATTDLLAMTEGVLRVTGPVYNRRPGAKLECMAQRSSLTNLSLQSDPGYDTDERKPERGGGRGFLIVLLLLLAAALGGGGYHV